MAVPRKRKSRSRRGNQRSHDALRGPTIVSCPSCAAPKLPHRMCPACGWYGDRQVMEIEAD
ncbi:MAG: 50S ribosomal protein L32 [Myxococcales bacterium]|nr:50S ribosomal protein L32 [Myxococcales bacterium]